MEETAIRPSVLIRDLPDADRPRERLRDYGVDALATAELIAILLRTGVKGRSALTVAHDLLSQFAGIGGLARASFGDLCGFHGLGPAKAAELQAAITLGVRAASVSPDARPVLRDPEAIAELVMASMSLLTQEEVRVIQLDTRARLMGMSTVYKGSVHSTAVRFGELLREAVKLNASAVVLIHNHPSGDPAPSVADITMTKGLVEAGKLMDIDIHDHIVIGGGRYVSLRAAGLGFSG